MSKLFIVVKAQVGNKQILYLNLVRYFPLISSVPYCALYISKTRAIKIGIKIGIKGQFQEIKLSLGPQTKLFPKKFKPDIQPLFYFIVLIFEGSLKIVL